MSAPAREATLRILDRLIGFPTVSAASNLELIDYAADLLGAGGWTLTRLPSACGTKAGLLARLGPGGPGGVLLSAHSDVVPAEGQAWTRPPFRLTYEGDRLFGRGTTDMKGFLAAMLSAAQRARAAPLSRPLMLAISYDEEVGCRGIREMLPGLRSAGWAPDLCIVGEPTGMRPAIGHKGKLSLTASCHGTAGHSAAAPLHVNALHLAADLIAALRRMQEDYARTGARDAGHALPYSTVHAGVMQGGRALNIVPDLATIQFELRHLPADPPEAFLSAIREEAARIALAHGMERTGIGGAAIGIEVTNAYPGLETPATHAAVARVARLCGSERPIKVGYGTEAGVLSGLGIPTVVCGPGDMDAQGHKPDESLEMAQLGACDLMMDRLLAELA